MTEGKSSSVPDVISYASNSYSGGLHGSSSKSKLVSISNVNGVGSPI